MEQKAVNPNPNPSPSLREAALQPHDRQLFYQLLAKASKYHEWGSGGSTVQASHRGLAVSSIESDAQWHAMLQPELGAHVNYVLVDLHCKANDWGMPGADATEQNKRAYSDAALAEGCDLVLIDGRFRVACALKLFQVIDAQCLVCFDDFLFRPAYHCIKEFYDIVESTEADSMVVLRKRDVAAPSAELIAHWELDSF